MKNKTLQLSKGDIIDVIAPASKADQRLIENSVQWLKSQGYEVRISKGINSGSEFFANDFDFQWNDLKNALTAKDSKAIWCMRGGWGTLRFIPKLLKLKKQTQKLFIGFSDITTLHLFFNSQWNWKTYHGHNLSVFGKSGKVLGNKNMLDILTGKTETQSFKKLKVLKGEDQIIKAPIIGGNLCVLTASLNAGMKLSAKGKILFLEDIGERGYQIDRYFEQLNQSGFLKGAKAIALGDFTDSLEPNGTDLKSVAFKRMLEKVNIPVIKGLPCGHGARNYLLPLNTNAELNLKERSLIIKR